MSVASGKWNDLLTRLISAFVLVVVAGFDIWMGGVWFVALLALSAAAMVWEAARLGAAPKGALRDMALPVSGALALVFGIQLGVPFGIVLVACAAAGVYLLSTQLRWRLFFYAFFAMIAAMALYAIRESFPLIVLLWVIGVVIASDVMGYFAGRLLGGPKFWPKVSPKKTWSGTIAGWFGATFLTLAMQGALTEAAGDTWPLPLPAFAVLLAFAAQMGDIAESALKRKAGIKDSSNLIPGHGGVLDRFDGLIGASLVFFVIWVIF